MALKKMSLKTTQKHQMQRLDQVLTQWLPHALAQPVSKSKVRKLIVAGATYLNGKRVRIASKPILPHVRIDVYVDLEKLNMSGLFQDRAFVMTSEHILFEDEDLIVVDKPPGLPTQPTLDEARDNLFSAVKKFLALRAGCEMNEIYLGLHHRLDRDTSGAILFTKSQRANPGISTAFSSRLAVKTYQALALNCNSKKYQKKWTIQNYLGVLNKQNVSKKKAHFGAVRVGGDFAHTDFKLIEQIGDVLHVEACLHTGRTHQIRVHLAEDQKPVLGDVLYGGTRQYHGVAISRVMLHAVDLTFPHPIYHNTISIHSQIPGDFSQCMKKFKDLEK